MRGGDLSPITRGAGVFVVIAGVTALSTALVAVFAPGMCWGSEAQASATLINNLILVVMTGLMSSLLTIVILSLKGVHKRQETQEKEVGNLKASIPEKYVQKEDFRHWESKLEQKIDKLFTMIEKVLGAPK